MLVIAGDRPRAGRRRRCSACCPRPRSSTRAGDERSRPSRAASCAPAWLPARPPGDVDGGWTVDPASGKHRADAPRAEVDGDTVTFTGDGRLGARRARRRRARRRRQRRLRRARRGRRRGARTATVEARHALRRHPRARPRDARRPPRAAGSTSAAEQIARAWYLAQALLAAESLGAVEAALEISVQYAKERFTFGRAIGSYQAVKHGLTEILRRSENARSLLYYAGWACDDGPRSSRWPPARRARRPARRSTSPRARTSPCTAASARRGSTTRRCTSAARSSRAGCWAGTGDATDRVAAELLAKVA